MKKTVLFLVFISENKFVLGTGSSHILRQTSIRVIENRACGADSENMLCAGKIIVKFKKLPVFYQFFNFNLFFFHSTLKSFLFGCNIFCFMLLRFQHDAEK